MCRPFPGQIINFMVIKLRTKVLGDIVPLCVSQLAVGEVLTLAECLSDRPGHRYMELYRVSQEERSIFWEVIGVVILSKHVHMNMCPIPNGFRGRAI